MKLFRHLILLGAVLVTLLFIIDTIDAKKKESKRKVIEDNYEEEIEIAKNGKNGKLKKTENGKIDKSKKFNGYKTLNSEDQFSKENKLETNKNNGKNGKKSIPNNGKNNKDNLNPKITKTYQKVKKYKVVEDVPAQKFVSKKKTPKKNKSQKTYKQEVVDEVFKNVKKTSQKKLTKERNSIDDVTNEELNKLNGDETIFIEEGDLGKNQKKKAYKLVEVVTEEDDENPEGNETIVEVGSEDEYDIEAIQRTESEEVIEKYKTTQTLKIPKTKNGPIEDANEELIDGNDLYENQGEESIQNDDMFADEESYFSRYEDPHNPNPVQKCKPLPEDPNRKGPKKLTFYVIEEEIDGKIVKYVVPESDGVTMCEVADLLREQIYGDVP